MSNLSTESTVVHEEDVEVLEAVHCELFEAVRKEVSGFGIRAVSDFRHLLVASEATTHPVVDTCIYS